MRVNNSTIIVLLAALAFVGSSTGCRFNGGPWYNPKSYTWAPSPFNREAPRDEKDKKALATNRPSLDERPNIIAPPSGYTSPGYTAPGMNYNVATKEEDAKFHANPGSNTLYNAPHAMDPSRLAAAPYGATTYVLPADNTRYSAAPPASPYLYPGTNTPGDVLQVGNPPAGNVYGNNNGNVYGNNNGSVYGNNNGNDVLFQPTNAHQPANVDRYAENPAGAPYVNPPTNPPVPYGTQPMPKTNDLYYGTNPVPGNYPPNNGY